MSGSNKTNILYVLQSLQGQFWGFHLLILDLNSDNDLLCFKSKGNFSQISDSK